MAKIHHITISPTYSNISSGKSQTYLVEAYKDRIHVIGDVSLSASFSISSGAGGYWLKNVYTAGNNGDWTVTAKYSKKTATASLSISEPQALFQLSDLIIQPQSVQIGETVKVSVTVTNVGSASGTKTIVMESDLMPPQQQSITLNVGEVQEISFSIISNSAGTHSVAVDGLAGTFICTAPPAPNIKLENLIISPIVCSVGQDVTISVTAKNYGELSGSKLVSCTIDSFVESKEVTLSPNQYQVLIFNTTPTTEKTYQVIVDGLSGYFVATSGTWSPWQYDINKDGIVDNTEVVAARDNFASGLITYDQMEQVFTIHMDTCQDYPLIQTLWHGAYSQLPSLRSAIKVGTPLHLFWAPDNTGRSWHCYIACVSKDNIQKFTGVDGGVSGWIKVKDNNYVNPSYVCYHFANDTAMGAYKALGYNVLPWASSSIHGYNIFWIGGDWHDLNNWWILEPQSGTIFCAGSRNMSTSYQTNRITLYSRRRTSYEGSPDHLEDVALVVDYPGAKIADPVYNYLVSSYFPNLEPPMEVFNRRLGL